MSLDSQIAFCCEYWLIWVDN